MGSLDLLFKTRSNVLLLLLLLLLILHKQGLKVRVFELRNEQADTSSATSGATSQQAQKKLLCEYEFKGEKCLRGAQCHKHHRGRQ